VTGAPAIDGQITERMLGAAFDCGGGNAGESTLFAREDYWKEDGASWYCARKKNTPIYTSAPNTVGS